jgi:hypothetical protein
MSGHLSSSGIRHIGAKPVTSNSTASWNDHARSTLSRADASTSQQCRVMSSCNGRYRGIRANNAPPGDLGTSCLSHGLPASAEDHRYLPAPPGSGGVRAGC